MITPASGYERGLATSQRIISDLGFIQNSMPEINQYKTSRKGAYVR